ncbi:DUF192 domain-containing protein [Thermaurantiacus sp.]
MASAGRALIAGLLLILPALPAAAREPVLEGPAAPNAGLPRIALEVETARGRHSYRVEVAATPAAQQTGMMFRTKVPPGTGMLFPFDPPRPAAFWMHNTFVALDIIFIGADGRVRNIAANATPMSLELRHSDGPVAAVLELAGGEAARIGLKPGDRVRWDSGAERARLGGRASGG